MNGTVNVPGISLAELKAVDDKAQKALDMASELANTIDAVPSQGGSLIYNGSVQVPTWNGYNPDMMTLGGVTSGTNAGTYQATFTPKGDYHWSDGTKTAKSVVWTINRAAISNPPAQSGSLTYTGGTLSPTWSGYNSAQLTIGGETSAINAGSHVATFTPTSNYQWSDGTNGAKSVTWSIQRAAISAIPAQSGSVTYTGNAQSPSWSNYNTAQLTASGSTSGTNAGTYTVNFTPTANYQWWDGSTGSKAATWSIAKAAGSLTLNKTSVTLNKATKTTTITATRAGDGTVTASSSNTGVATVSVSGTTITVTGIAYGSVTVTVKVAAGTNHNAPANKTCSVKVNIFNATLNSNTWAAIGAASAAGEGPNTWAVGDTKTISINGAVGNYNFSNLSISVFILGFNHNSAKEGSNRIHWQIGKISNKMVALCDSQYGNEQTGNGYFHMNTSRTNVGGWKSSVMRTRLGNGGTPTSPPSGTLLAALPSDLRGVMKATTKYTDNVGNAGGHTAGNVTATTDYLFLLAEFEVFGSPTYANNTEKNSQAQYDYYKAGNSRVAYNHGSTSAAVLWWLRSPHCSSSNFFCLVTSDGSYAANTASWSWGVVPGFST